MGLRVFLICFLALLPTLAQETHVQLDPAATTVHYTVGSTLHTVHGTFKLKSSDLWFNASTGKAGGKLVVDAASGQSGSGARDSRMKNSILEAQKYPDITFQPDRVDGHVNLGGDSAVTLHGTLTIHGGTHEMTMKVNSHITAEHLTGTIDFDVPYIQWGMKNPSTFVLRVDDTVKISIEASGQLTSGA